MTHSLNRDVFDPWFYTTQDAQSSEIADLAADLDEHHQAFFPDAVEGDVKCPQSEDGKPPWKSIQPEFLQDICAYYNNFAKWRTEWDKTHPHDMDSILFIAQMQNAAFATLFDHVHCLSINSVSEQRINTLLADDTTRAANIATLSGEPSGPATHSPRCVFDLGSTPDTKWNGSGAQTPNLWYGHAKHDTLIPTWSWARPTDAQLGAGPDGHGVAINHYNTPSGTPIPLKLKQVNPIGDSDAAVQRRQELVQCIPSRLLHKLRMEWSALPPAWKGGYNMLKVPVLKFTVENYYEYWPPLGAPAKILFEQDPAVAFGLQFPDPLGNPGAILQNYPRLIIQPQKLNQVVNRALGQAESYLVAPAIVQIVGDFRYAQAMGDHPDSALTQTLEKYRPIAAHTGGGLIAAGVTAGIELKTGDTITQGAVTGEITKDVTTTAVEFPIFAQSHDLDDPLKPEVEMVITRAGVGAIVTFTAGQVLTFQDAKRFRVTAPWSLYSQYPPSQEHGFVAPTEAGLPQADTRLDALSHLTPFVNGSDITTLRHLKTIQKTGTTDGETEGMQVFEVEKGWAGHTIPAISGTPTTVQPFPMFGTKNLIVINPTAGVTNGPVTEGAEAPYNTSIGQAAKDFTKAVRSFLGGTSRGNAWITLDDGTPLYRPLSTDLNSSWLGTGNPLIVSGDWLEIVDDSVTEYSGDTLKLSDPFVTQYIVDTTISYYLINSNRANRLTVDRGAPSNGVCVSGGGLTITWTPNADQVTDIAGYSVAVGGDHNEPIFGNYHGKPAAVQEHIAIGDGIVVDTVTEIGGTGHYTVTLKPSYEVIQPSDLIAKIATIAANPTPVQFRSPGKRFSWQPITSMHGVFSNVKLTTDSYSWNSPRRAGRLNNYSISRDYDLTGRKGAYDIVILLCWQYKLTGVLPKRMPSSLHFFLRDVMDKAQYESAGIQNKITLKNMFIYITDNANLVHNWGIWAEPGGPDMAAIFRTRHRLPDLELLTYTGNNSGGSAFLPVVLPSHKAIDLRKKMRYILGSYQVYHLANEVADYKVALQQGGDQAYTVSWPIKIVSDSEKFCVENLDVIVRVLGNWKLTTHEYNIRLATQFNYMRSEQIWPLKTASGFVITAYSGANPVPTSPYLKASMNLTEEVGGIQQWTVTGNDQRRSGILTGGGTVVGGPLLKDQLVGRLANPYAFMAGFPNTTKFDGQFEPKSVDKRTKTEAAYKTRFQTALIFLIGYITQGLSASASSLVQHNFIGALTCYMFAEVKHADAWHNASEFQNEGGSGHFSGGAANSKLLGYDWDTKNKWPGFNPRIQSNGFHMTCNLDIIRNYVNAMRLQGFLEKPRYGYQPVQQPNYGASTEKQGGVTVPVSTYKTLPQIKTDAIAKSLSYTPSILMNNRWKMKKRFFGIPHQGTTYGWEYDGLGASASTPPRRFTPRGGALANTCVWCSVLTHLAPVTPTTLSIQSNLLVMPELGQDVKNLNLLRGGFGFVQIQKYSSAEVHPQMDSAPNSVVTLPILTCETPTPGSLGLQLAQPMEPELVNFLNAIMTPDMGTTGTPDERFDMITTYAHPDGEETLLGAKQALVFVCVPDALGQTQNQPHTQDFLARASAGDSSTLVNMPPQLAARVSQRNSQVTQVATTGTQGVNAVLTVKIRSMSQLGTPVPAAGTAVMLYANPGLDERVASDTDLRYLGEITVVDSPNSEITLELNELVGSPAAVPNYAEAVTALELYIDKGVSPLLVRLNDHNLMAGFDPKTSRAANNTTYVEISGGKVRKQILQLDSVQPTEVSSVSKTVGLGVLAAGAYRWIPVKKGGGTPVARSIITCARKVTGLPLSTIVSNNGSNKAVVTVDENRGMITVGTEVTSHAWTAGSDPRWTGIYTVTSYTVSGGQMHLVLSGEADSGTPGIPTTLLFSNMVQLIEPSHEVRVSGINVQPGTSNDFLYIDRPLPVNLLEDDVLTITPEQMIKLPLTPAMKAAVTDRDDGTQTKLYLRPTADYQGITGGTLSSQLNASLSAIRPGTYGFDTVTAAGPTIPTNAKLELVVPALVTMTNTQFRTLNPVRGARIYVGEGGLSTYPYQGMLNSTFANTGNRTTMVVYPTPSSPVWPTQEHLSQSPSDPGLNVKADSGNYTEEFEFPLRQITSRTVDGVQRALFTCGIPFPAQLDRNGYMHVTFSSARVGSHNYKNSKIVDECKINGQSKRGFLLRLATGPGLPTAPKLAAPIVSSDPSVENYWFELHRMTQSYPVPSAADFVPLKVGTEALDDVEVDNPSPDLFLPIKLVRVVAFVNGQVTNITSVNDVTCDRGTTDGPQRPFFRAIQGGKYPEGATPGPLTLVGNADVAALLNPGTDVICQVQTGDVHHVGVPGLAARFHSEDGDNAVVTIDAYDSTTVGLPGYANRSRNFAELTHCVSMLQGFTLGVVPMPPQWSIMLEYDPYLSTSMRRNKWALNPIGESIGSVNLGNLDNRGYWSGGVCRGYFRDWEYTRASNGSVNTQLTQNNGSAAVSLTDPVATHWEPLKYGLVANSDNSSYITQTSRNPLARTETADNVNGGMETMVSAFAFTAMTNLIPRGTRPSTLCTAPLVTFTAEFTPEPYVIMEAGETGLGHDLVENRLAFYVDNGAQPSNYPASFPAVSGFYGGQRVEITQADGAAETLFPSGNQSALGVPFTVQSYISSEPIVLQAEVVSAPLANHYTMILKSVATVRAGDVVMDVTSTHVRGVVVTYDQTRVELHPTGGGYTPGVITDGALLTFHRPELRYIQLKPALTTAQRTWLTTNDARLTIKRFPTDTLEGGIPIYQGPEHVPAAGTKSFCSNILGTIRSSDASGDYHIVAPRQMRDGGCSVNGVPTILSNVQRRGWASTLGNRNQPINLEASRVLNKTTLTNSVINPGCTAMLLEFDYNPWSSNRYGSDGRLHVEKLEVVNNANGQLTIDAVFADCALRYDHRTCPSFMALSSLAENESGPLGYRLEEVSDVLDFAGLADCPTPAYTRLYRFGPPRVVVVGGVTTYRTTLKKWNGANVAPGDINVASGTNNGGFVAAGDILEPPGALSEWIFDPCDRRPMNIDEVSLFNNPLSTRINDQRTWLPGDFNQVPASTPPNDPGGGGGDSGHTHGPEQPDHLRWLEGLIISILAGWAGAMILWIVSKAIKKSCGGAPVGDAGGPAAAGAAATDANPVGGGLPPAVRPDGPVRPPPSHPPPNDAGAPVSESDDTYHSCGDGDDCSPRP